MNFVRVGSGIALLLFTASCGDSEKVKLPVEIELDAAFTPEQKQVIASDFEWLSSFDFSSNSFSVSAPSSSFEQVFGGNTSADVLRYLDDRTGYYVAPRTKFEQRVYAQSVQVPTLKGPGKEYARNLGGGMFLIGLMQNISVGYAFGDDEMIPVDDSRVGIIQLLAPLFSGLNQSYGAREVVRTSVYIHEARHSDCTGGIGSKVLQSLKADRISALSETQCMHAHATCPERYPYSFERHPYAGEKACDANPWGAYAVGAAYASRIANCSDCSEEQVQVALMLATDSLSRLLPSAKKFGETMTVPDMSHSPKIVEDTE